MAGKRQHASVAVPQGPLVSGSFIRKSRGHGFVRPEGALPGSREGDIYIPATAAGDASNGDTVRVRVSKARDVRRPGPAGEIVKVIARKTTRFVGSYFEAAGTGRVSIDGDAFARPVSVGDPGAKGVASRTKLCLRWSASPPCFGMGRE
jgi:ribonuclease R